MVMGAASGFCDLPVHGVSWLLFAASPHPQTILDLLLVGLFFLEVGVERKNMKCIRHGSQSK